MMKIGKISETILKRSVFKQIQTRREEILQGAGVGEDCAAVKLKPDEIFVLSTDPITGTAQDIGFYGIHITLNDLASSGATPIGVMLTILLPDGCEEIQLRIMMKQIEQVCAENNIQIMGGHTEVTTAVNQPLLSVCGVGKAKQDALITTGGAKPGQDIVITKWIALEGTSIIAKEKEAELQGRFCAVFLDTAKKFDQYLSVLPEAAIAVRFGVSAMHDVTEGGIFGALWELAEASGIGLAVDLKKIPIKQESIEICEYFGINPYELISSGSMLMAASDGNGLVRTLQQAGIPAVVAGKAVSGKDRLILNEDEKRFLEPPKVDELYKVVK